MKDYKKTESLDAGLVEGSGIIWMFSGIVLGLMVGIGMYFLSNQNTPLLSSTDSVQNKIVEAQDGSSVKNKVAKTTPIQPSETVARKTKPVPFSYYAVLPNLDVPVAVNAAKPIETRVEVIAENSKQVEIVATQVDIEEKQKSRKKGNYLLQVASFKRKSMADLTRGRLAKKGIKAHIKKRKLKGRMWYRVVAGPVSQGNIDSWKHKAEKLGHKPMVISVR